MARVDGCLLLPNMGPESFNGEMVEDQVKMTPRHAAA
jgi:hypothetical protein